MFAVFFGISQNFSDFDRSDAKIAMSQRIVKKQPLYQAVVSKAVHGKR